MSDLRSNEGVNGWQAIKYGGILMAGLAGIGMMRRGMRGLANSGVGRETEKMIKTGGQKVVDTAKVGKMMGAGSLFGGSELAGVLSGATAGGFGAMRRWDQAGSRAGRGLLNTFSGLGKWATASGMQGNQRLAAATMRMGAVGAGAYAASYANPFTDSGTFGGTVGTLGMGAVAFGAYGLGRGAFKALSNPQAKKILNGAPRRIAGPVASASSSVAAGATMGAGGEFAGFAEQAVVNSRLPRNKFRLGVGGQTRQIRTTEERANRYANARSRWAGQSAAIRGNNPSPVFRPGLGGVFNR